VQPCRRFAIAHASAVDFRSRPQEKIADTQTQQGHRQAMTGTDRHG
jgi:hypothetical protein